MGSHIDSEDEFTVFVTGFGPFKAAYPVNPSWEIARRLPSYLPLALPSEDESSNPDKASPIPLPPVRILVHPEPVRVNYEVVRSLVPSFWESDPQDGGGNGTGDNESMPTTTDPDSSRESVSQGKGEQSRRRRRIDLCLHIGMAGPRMHYSIEHRGHRDGYAMPDVDGHRLEDEDRRRREKDDWVWSGVPPELFTELDVRDVLKRWRGHSSAGADLRVSEDAGRYLCDFIYFSSLAHLYKTGEHRRVIFLHVPCDATEATIASGKELAINLIRALVESELGRQRDAEIRRGDKIAVDLRV